ncbi:MAG: CAP domain-containing protein, partial [Polyangiaceae bacterium]|nr:CAP domain-containing protein [Polyangiaceae bacterium]
GGSSSGGATSGGGSSSGGATSGGGTGGTATGGTGGGGTSVCARWKADRADMAEGTWSGSVASCNAGDVTANGRANALKMVNLYRFIVGLPQVTNSASMDQQAQACALMMDANNQLSHTPPSSWQCYTSVGAGSAGKSNIATTPGVAAVDLYMADPGNSTTIGHRRWILSNSLGPIGLGTTNSYSCMQVIGGSGSAGKQWVAFPPGGEVPVQMFKASFSSLDQTGWTIQSDSIALAGAQVTVTDGGANQPVTVTQLQGGYGSKYALRFNPQGWTTQAGHTYSVSVSGVSQPIAYDVKVVSCN